METSEDKEENGDRDHFSERKTMQSYMARPTSDESSFLAMMKFYCCPFDARYEDLGEFGSSDFCKVILRDCMAGFVVAMVAIPMAMGFAVASGLKPVQGIVGGAIAGLIGALFGGSKYQVYGPTAAFIPVMHGIMALHMEGGALYTTALNEEEIFHRGHGLLVLISLVAAVMLIGLSLARVGSLVAKVPNCILVGFTIGIAFTIAFGFAEEALGLPEFKAATGVNVTNRQSGQIYQTSHHLTVNPHMPGETLWPKLEYLQKELGHINAYALLLTIATAVCMQLFARISLFIPAVLILITLLCQTLWKDKELRTVFDNYGHIPQTMTLTPPIYHPGDAPAYYAAGIIAYYAVTITVVGAVESLICSRMADTLADNLGTPFHPNKELWAQGLVNAVVPLFNGFPHNGALARTALNIKLGAVTPLAGIMKCIFKLLMVFVFSRSLEMMPMAAIAGLLWYVAFNMVSLEQLGEVYEDGGWAHVAVTVVTAVLVVTTDIVHGIAFGMLSYAIGFFLEPHVPEALSGRGSGRGSGRKEIGTDDEKQPIMVTP